MAAEANGFNWWRDKLKKDAERRRKARKHYPWNVRLLAFVIAGATFWYYWHVEPMLRGTTILGTPLTFWAGLKFAQSWFPASSRFSEDATKTPHRLLAQPYARRYLCAAAGLVAVLLLTTSSVYLKYDESQGQGDYEVEIYRGENLLIAPQKVSSYNSLCGKTYFFNVSWLFRPWELELSVKQPPYRYDTTRLTVQSPWRYRVKVPTAFEEKNHRIFRVLPDGTKWMGLSARKDDPLDTRFRLVILLKQKYGQKELCRAPYFFEPVYFGGPAEMIAFFQQAERETNYHRWNVVGHLKKRYREDPDTFEAKALLLMDNETVCETIQVKESATLIIRLLIQDLATKEWTESTVFEHKVGPEAGIQNIYVPN